MISVSQNCQKIHTHMKAYMQSVCTRLVNKQLQLTSVQLFNLHQQQKLNITAVDAWGRSYYSGQCVHDLTIYFSSNQKILLTEGYSLLGLLMSPLKDLADM